MATITKNGYTYDTEAKTRTSPTGKVVSVENMDAITPNLQADTPMSLNSLNQTNQLNLPEKTPEVSPTYTLTPLETFERETQTRADTSDKNYLDTQKAIGEAEARELTYQEELGASENLKAFKDYERQLQAEQLALRRFKEDISGETAMSEAMTNATIRQEEERSLRKQADIAILGNTAMGNYNEAIQVAKSKVEMELKPLTRQLDYYKSVMDRNQDLLTKSQTAKLQSLYADVEREKNKEEERLTKGNEMIINAIQGGASKSLIDNANNLLTKGGKVSDVVSVLGQYSMSPEERINLKAKQVQLNQAIQKVQEVSGQEIKPEDKVKIETFTDIVRLAGELKTAKGKEAATGKSFFLGKIWGTSAYSYKEKVEQLVNTLAAGNLDKLKGAMSDKDILFLQKINTNLSTKLSEKEFDKELNRIYNTITSKLSSDYGIDYTPDLSGVSNDDLINLPQQTQNNSDFFNNIKL